jgi:hypothetical protein
MSDKRSIFYQDWRDCLRAHYMHVIRTNDQITEPTLHGVLIRTGFTEDEIKEMAVQARMRDTEAHPDDLPSLD